MPAHILVIDDSAIVSAVVTRLLGRAGYIVQIAASGQAGLDAVRHAPPDLILLDITMPGIDGFTVCRRLKGSRATAAIPIMLLSGLDDQDSNARGTAAGADDMLAKPFDPQILLERVAALWERTYGQPMG
jgi:DNA-binding response OmpR family regulator